MHIKKPISAAPDGGPERHKLLSARMLCTLCCMDRYKGLTSFPVFFYIGQDQLMTFGEEVDVRAV